MRALAVLLCLAAVAFVRAQGSAGGYGQGGGYSGSFGGGLGGGGAGGRFGDATNVPESHPEDDAADGGRLYETRTAILTSGDRVEYKLKVEKGETLFAGATSDAFDPALAVEDPSGKTLAKNDDREEGDQAPFIAFRFPEAGTYTLKVLSYKQASGGKFTLKMRTFVASDAPLGRSVHDFPDLRDDAQRVEIRISAKRGEVYDLRETYLPSPPGGLPSFVRIVGSSGVEHVDFVRVATADGSPVFEAKTDGDYYVEYASYGPTRFATDLRLVPVLKTTADGEVKVELAPGDLMLAEFSVAARDVVRTTIDGPGAYRLTAPYAPPDRVVNPGNGAADPAWGFGAAWVWFSFDRDSQRDVVRVYRAAGTARVAVRSYAQTRSTITLRNSTTLPEWKPGRTIKGRLEVGEVRLYRLRSASAELMCVAANSPTFKPRLDIFRLNGELANTLPVQAKHTAADDLYFPKEDDFLVRLSCDGYGGSGEFTLRRDTPPAVPLKLGATTALTLDGTDFSLYAVDLEAGKRYQLTTDEPEGTALRADLLDEDGTFLRSQAIRFDKVTVQYFVPNRSGRHRLWLRGAAGVRRFRLEPSVAPTLGGG